MSFSAPQSKMPSPARTPRVSTDEGRRPGVAGNSTASVAARDQRERERAHKPAGIINLGMTCFLNSTFQALSATPALIALLSANPALPLIPRVPTPLPPPAQLPSQTPCLLPDALEPPLYGLLPVTRAFTNSLHKAWTTKERGGGTAGAGEASSLHCISLSQLLREIARKYDQYDAFAQQDAHELLRHLLDSMEMEEKDVIKRKGTAPRTPASPAAPLPVSATSTPAVKPAALAPEHPAPALSVPASPAPSVGALPEDRMLPFVDLLFGGLLASVVVCDTCKSVSHTYEGFLDLSLSMRGDDDAPKPRKRDKFRSIASRLKPGPRPKGANSDAVGVMSEPEGSDTDSHRHHLLGHGRTPSHSHGRHETSDREADQGVNGTTAALSRASSSAKGLKASFSFRRGKPKGKEGLPPSSSTPALAALAASPGHSAPSSPIAGSGAHPPSVSPSISPLVLSEALPSAPGVPPTPHSPHMHMHQAAPTPAQAAYIARILYGPPAAPEVLDPLAKLRAAHAGGLGSANAPKQQEYGLIESLRAFTGVETLEGDNAFACHKCWKIKNGHYRRDTNSATPSSGSTGHEQVPKRPSALALPAIAVEESETETTTTPGSPAAEMSRLGRLMSRTKAAPVRAASPLRQVVDPATTSPTAQDTGLPVPFDDISRTETVGSMDSSVSSVSASTSASSASTSTSASASSTGTASTVVTSLLSASVPSTATVDSFATTFGPSADHNSLQEQDQEMLADDTSSDGLSDSTDDEELPSGPARFFRPPMGKRRPSKHFVLRRAFKRYMVAKAPEVLVFHIKRFKQTQGAYSTFSSLRKLDDVVTFPETLDLAPFMAPSRSDFKCVKSVAPFMDWPAPERPPEPAPMSYKLYAVVVHLGTMLSGHYIAYVLVDPERVFLPPGETAASVAAAAAAAGTTGGAGTAAATGTVPAAAAEGGAEETVATETAEEAEKPKPEEKVDRRVWCYCSDTQIRLANVEEVLAARAYLCFYEKVHV